MKKIPTSTAHIENQRKFPLLALICENSDLGGPDNYFSVLQNQKLLPGDERQFLTWEHRVSMLDPDSLRIFSKKVKSRISIREEAGRDWSPLIETFNELKGYEHAIALGYETIRFIGESPQSLPDIKASGVMGDCLIEVKTINESALELSLRGRLQKGEKGLPPRLRAVLLERYEKARSQILAHPAASNARKICFFIIDLDLRTVLKTENKQELNRFLDQIKSDIEIHSISQHWPAELRYSTKREPVVERT